MKYDVTIGLEVHCELETESKLFCDCPNEFGGGANTHCCPVCAGFPGVMPALNKRAVEDTVLTGLALNCRINKYSRFDRKNYFYPDLAKAWQTSQYDLPFCSGGFVEFPSSDGKTKKARINRIHLEEDAGKLIHTDFNTSLVDYNRAGVPLMEIVTEPDFTSADDAAAFLETLRAIIVSTGVSKCKMQEGQLRCDVNVSLKPAGAKELGTRTETKNLNSFKAAYRAVSYEIERQREILDGGGKITQETRRFDDAEGRNYSMRSKEDAHDYRYFPEPDLPPVSLTDADIERIRKRLPELPADRKRRYTERLKLPEYDAGILTADAEVSAFFDECVKRYGNPKTVSNIVMGDVLRLLKSGGAGNAESVIKITPDALVGLLGLVDKNVLSLAAAKEVLNEIWLTGKTADAVIKEKNLAQNNDAGGLSETVKKIIKDNPKPVAEYLSGNEKVLAFFTGQAMKATQGKGNPKIITELLKSELGKLNK